MQRRIRLRHLSYQTERWYLSWLKRFEGKELRPGRVVLSSAHVSIEEFYGFV